MVVNESIQNIKSADFSTDAVVKAAQANWKILESLTEELAAKVGCTGKNDGQTSLNALNTFIAVRHEACSV
jgi:hypothetical protein